VLKAVGMTPGQVIAMVMCRVAGTEHAAGALAVPAEIALHRCLLPVIAAAGTGQPGSGSFTLAGADPLRRPHGSWWQGNRG
jgi:hypothetical protein